ncbi:MAG TPA: hypothetical protein VLN45_08625, partial [Ignavibacteriaceae bacterium]|nr:hypothetical protein [Ignavibacteriaceae bacterium]
MILKTSLLIILFFSPLFFVCTLNAQDQNKPIVTIGDEQITVKDFKHRYELSPFITSGLNSDSIKYYFLMSLVAEKLFAIEAKNLGLEQSDKFDFAYKP